MHALTAALSSAFDSGCHSLFLFAVVGYQDMDLEPGWALGIGLGQGVERQVKGKARSARGSALVCTAVITVGLLMAVGILVS